MALTELADGSAIDQNAVIERVAIDFADEFGPTDRLYGEREPQWQELVRLALTQLAGAGLITDEQHPQLTDSGRAEVAEPSAALEPPAAPETAVQDAVGPPGVVDPAPDSAGDGAPILTGGVIAGPLRGQQERRRIGVTDDPNEPFEVMLELNMMYGAGVGAAFDRLRRLWHDITGQDGPYRLTEQYASGLLSMNQVMKLSAADSVPVRWPQRCLERIWPDFPIRPHMDRSCVTIKSDAARRSFNADGDGVVWGVIDTGIWGDHPHFASYNTLSHPSVRDLHRTFLAHGDPIADGALSDEDGHGTHVAGIIAGGIGPWLTSGRSVRVTESRFNAADAAHPSQVPRDGIDPSMLAGMAPKTRLVSLKAVNGEGSDQDRVGRVVNALGYVREVNSGGGDALRIHGVNLSLGYEFDANWFACGQSPLCKEVDKLVRSGVVVVVAAGNSGYGRVTTQFVAPSSFDLPMTINDPGNSELAITVGSTHRDSPHTFGVSFFSSKGPTGDGRNKPDLVAPGERISSCAAGGSLTPAMLGDIASVAPYLEQSGTSVAAPHVSGAAAALMSVRREFIGSPDRLKEILVSTAIDLGRDRQFQGTGLLDLLGALQSV